MSSVILTGDTSGTLTVSAPAVAGSNTLTLAAATGTLSPLVSGTAVTASGTSVDFTSIPSWVKRITVMFSGVSTNSTSLPQIQIGDSGGIETTGYTGRVSDIAAGTNTGTSGIILSSDNSAASVYNGQIIIININSNQWVGSSTLVRSDAQNAYFSAYNKTLSDVLDRVRITTVNGTDTFDAGTINIMYEG